MLRRRRSKKRQLLWHSFASSFPSASFSLLSAPPLPLPSIGAADPVASKTAKTRNRREARRMWLRASKRERRKDDEEKKVKLAKERVEKKKKKLSPSGSPKRGQRAPPLRSLSPVKEERDKKGEAAAFERALVSICCSGKPLSLLQQRTTKVHCLSFFWTPPPKRKQRERKKAREKAFRRFARTGRKKGDGI